MATSVGKSNPVGISTSITETLNSNNNNNNNNSNGVCEKPRGLLETSATRKQSPSPKMTRKKDTNRKLSPDERALLPPGPKGLPCVGSIFEWKGPETNLAWTRQYGSVYRVRMANKHLVYLNTIELVEKYMEGRSGEQYLDRPMGPAAIGEGILFGSGDLWKKNKRAFMKALYTKTFDADMEEAVQSEIQLALKELHKNVDEPIKLGDFLLPACSCVIPGLLLGKTLPPGSPDREELMKVTRNMEGVDLSSLFTKMSLKYSMLSKITFTVDVHGTSKCLQNLLRSWIREATANPLSPTSPRTNTAFFQVNTSQTQGETEPAETCPFKRRSSKRLKTDDETVSTEPSLCSEQTESCPYSGEQEPNEKERILAAFGFTDTGPGEVAFEETEPPPEQPVPLTPLAEQQWTFDRQMSLNLCRDSILQRILKQEEYADVTEGTDAELLQSLIDMFFGGATSTLAALEYIFVHLVRNPDAQKLAREEVDKAVSENDGSIVWSMRKDMPYVNACIREALRLGSVTPSSLPHVATKDTEIEGYKIPQGTYVLASIYSLHRDPVHYLDPGEFMPQRHLTGRQHTSYRPYGIGARRCVGTEMSNMQLFVYTAYILRHFELEPISSKCLPSLDTHMRIINRLKDFRCKLRKRDV